MNFKPQCPVCGENNWEPDGIAATPTMNDKGEISPTEVIPTVFMCCNCCGYVMQLSAVKIGLVP
jgi:predicted nucleic-acid-binding Zn-ribbon protein